MIFVVSNEVKFLEKDYKSRDIRFHYIRTKYLKFWLQRYCILKNS